MSPKLTNEQIERINKLADALESGKFKKGKNRLRTRNETYCCLGVACYLYGRAMHKNFWRKLEEFGYIFRRGSGSNLNELEDVQRWYGFNYPNGFMVLENTTNESIPITNLNDADDFNFTQLAALFRLYAKQGIVSNFLNVTLEQWTAVKAMGLTSAPEGAILGGQAEIEFQD